jgi:hypothetical protein
MGEHIPNAPEQGRIVEDRLSRVTTLPEAPAPSDELPDLLRDVREQVLHEPRKVAAWCADDEVHVVRHHAERKELDSMETYGSGQYAPEDLVRLV